MFDDCVLFHDHVARIRIVIVQLDHRLL